MRPDLDIHPLRGNVDTRMRKLVEGGYDAIILAAAGLNRLGRTELVREVIAVDVMCPAAGQGALGIEIRAGDAEILAALAFLDDRDARRSTTSERALLNALGGGCQVPIGAFAVATGESLKLHAVVARPDGSKVLRASSSGVDSEHLGQAVAQALLQSGAEAILDEVYGRSS